MKLRTGFVSNSSSSSFVVTIKKGTKIKNKEELEKNNNTILNQHYGKNWKKDYPELVSKYEDEYILLMNQIEYGGEEDARNIVLKLLQTLGYDTDNFEITIGD